MNNEILRVSNLSKKFDHVTALDGVSLTIEKGKIYGFIGRNGAEKITLMRMITGLSYPTQGDIALFDNSDLKGLERGRSRIGCMIEHAALYPSLTASQNLHLFRKLKNIDDKRVVLSKLFVKKRRTSMKRSLMQLYIPSSKQAVEFYAKAFQTNTQNEYLDDQGNFLHVELNVLGQMIACSHLYQKVDKGNTMQFCFQLNENEKEWMEHAYQILKENATIDHPIGACFYSPTMFSLVDQFGINWCMFI